MATRPNRLYITLLRLPLAVGVVFIHAQQGALPPHTAPLHMQGVDQWRWWLSSALPSLAVATFFLIAGFLFFQGYTPQAGWSFFRSKWKSRLHTLLLPYLVWNAIKFVQLWGKHGWDSLATHWHRVEGFNLLWGEHTIGREQVGLFGLPLGQLHAPINVPLWFVRDLMVFCLLTPLLALLLRRKVRAIALLLLAFGAYALHTLPYPLGISLRSLPMFMLGAAIALHGGDLYAPLRRWRWPLYASYAALLLTQWSGHGQPAIILLTTAIGIATYLALAGHVAERLRQLPKWYVQLSGGSFLLYAAHTVGLLEGCVKLVKAILPGVSPQLRTLHYLLPPLLCVVVCLALFVILRRYFPRLSAPLTGLWTTQRSPSSHLPSS